MTDVISVRFRSGCKEYYFDPKGLTIPAGTDVIVETAQGPEFAHCAAGNHQVPDDAVVKPLRSVLRIATDNDKHTAAYNRSREKEAFDVCKKKIQQHKLEMKLVRVECSFDGSKILFFFTADGRVDFRELVKDLAGVFRARIELRQIGVRDEAKMIGGLLMCCLKYEQDAYEDAIKRLPKNDSFVLTPDGTGNVSDVNVLKETVNVRLDDRTDGPRCYHNCEVCVLRNGKGSRDGIAVPDKRPERYVEPLAEEELPTITLLSDFDPDAAAESEKKRGRRSRSRRRGDGEKRTAEKPAAPAEKAPRSDIPAEGGKPRREGGDRRRRSGRRGGNGGANAAGSTGAPAPKAVKPAGDGQGTVSVEKKRSRHRPRRRSGGSKPNGGTEA